MSPRSRVARFVPAVLLCSLAVPAGAASAAPPVDAVPPPAGVTRVSVAVTGEPDGISARFSRPALSRTGRFVAFDSAATNLVPGDTNEAADVFVRDTVLGRTDRVSVASDGTQSDSDSSAPALSGDGRVVVFTSSASTLVAGGARLPLSVYAHDRTTDRTTLVSAAADGTPGNGASFMADVTRDGRYVVFVSDATNLVTPNVAPGRRNVYLKDLTTGAVERVSRSVSGSALTDAAGPVISDDARWVAFSAFSSEVVAGDTNFQVDTFLHDRRSRRTTRISVDSAERQVDDGLSAYPSISADGRFVAFASEATTLVPGDTNGGADVFVRDVVAGTTTRVSLTSTNGQADGGLGFGLRGGSVFGPDLSANGRYVTFNSVATNLVPGDTNTCSYRGGASFPVAGQCPDVFVRDRWARTTTRVSVAADGSQADGANTDPAISADGRAVAFFSTATNLAGTDTNTCLFPLFGTPGTCPDVYLATR